MVIVLVKRGEVGDGFRVPFVARGSSETEETDEGDFLKEEEEEEEDS